MSKAISLLNEGKNKKLKAPDNYEQLLKKVLEVWVELDSNSILFQYVNADNTVTDVTSEEHYSKFLTQDPPLKLLVKQKISEPVLDVDLPKIRVVFNDGYEFYVLKTSTLEDFVKSCSDYLNLDDPNFVINYIGDGDELPIADQDDFDLYLDDPTEPNIMFQSQQSEPQTFKANQPNIQSQQNSNSQSSQIQTQIPVAFINSTIDQFPLNEENPLQNFQQLPNDNQDDAISSSPLIIADNQQDTIVSMNQVIDSDLENTLLQQWEKISIQDKELYDHIMTQDNSQHQSLYQEIHQDSPLLAAYMREVHPGIDKTQENIEQDPLTWLKQSFDKFQPNNDNIVSKLPSKTITTKNFQEFKQILSQQSQQKPAYETCLVEIDKRLAVGQDFSTLFTHEIFVSDPSSPLYNFDDTKLLVFFAERQNEKSCRAFALYGKIPGKPLPFAFKSVTDQPKTCIPLSSFQELFDMGQPSIISIGPSNCGKSKLLNKLFTPIFSFAEEIDIKKYPLHWGIQVVCHTDEFPLGFNVFDAHMDFSSQSTSSDAQQDSNNVIDILKIFPKIGSLILLHALTKEDMSSNIDVLISNGWKSEQIICLIRDSSKVNVGFSLVLKNPSRNAVKVKTISKIEKSNIFDSDIAKLRADILELARITPDVPVNYYHYEEEAQNIQRNDFKIYFVDKDDKQFELKVIEIFSHIKPNQQNDFNLHNELFKALKLRGELFDIQNKEKLAHQQPDFTQKIHEINICQQKIEKIQEKLQIVVPHQAVLLFNEIIQNQNSKMMKIFERQIGIWQEPIIKPLTDKRKKMAAELQSLQNQLIKHDVADSAIANDPNMIEKYGNEILTGDQKANIIKCIEPLKVEIKQVSLNLDKIKVSKEHFFRELDYLYERFQNQSPQHIPQINRGQYLDSLVEYVRSGCEFEFIDGENNRFHELTMNEIFTRLEQKYGEERPFVISIIGPQSTGKSTLLNFLFNTSFMMSAGRCTKGMYASCFETDHPAAKRVVILDSEGLLSIEKNDPTYDKKITTLGMSLSQVLLINVMGDFNQAMKEILAMSLLAGKQLKTFLNKRPILIFVLRNCIDDNISMMREIVDKIGDELKKVADAAQVKVHEIVDYRDDQSFCLMYSAFNKDDYSQEGKKLYSFCIVNDSFRNKSVNLLQQIFKEAENPKIDRAVNLKQLVRKAKDIWASLQSYNQLLSLKSIKDLNDRQELQYIVNELRNTFIEKEFSVVKEQNQQVQDLSNIQQTLAEKMEALLFREDLTLKEMKENLETYEYQYQDIVKIDFQSKTKAAQLEQDLLKEYQDMLVKNVSLMVQRNQDELQRREAFSEIMTTVENIKKEMNNYMRKALDENAAKLEQADIVGKGIICDKLEEEFSHTMKLLEQKLEQSIEEKKKPREAICVDTYKFLKQVLTSESMSGRTFLSISHLDYANQKSDQSRVIKDPIYKMIITPTEETAKSFDKMLCFLIEATEHNSGFYTNKILSQRRQAYQNEGENQIQSQQPRQNPSSSVIQTLSNWLAAPFNYFTQQKPEEIKYKNVSSKSKRVKNEHHTQDTPQYSNTLPQDQYLHNQSKQYKKGQITQEDIELEVGTILKQVGVYAFIEIKSTIISACVKISTSQGVNSSMIQTLLKDIEQSITQAETYYLTPHIIHFKKGYFEQLVASVLFEAYISFMLRAQNEKIKNEKLKFQEQVSQMGALFKDKLKSFLGDSEAASFLANLIHNNLIGNCKITSQKRYKDILTTVSNFQPGHLLSLGDKIVESDYSTQNKDFVDWATNVSVYLDRLFDKEFAEKQKKARSDNFRDRKQELLQSFQNLLEALDQIKNSFIEIEINKIDFGQVKKDDAEPLQKLLHQLLMKCLFEPKTAINTVKEIVKIYLPFQISEEKALFQFNLLPNKFSQIDLLGNQESILQDAKIINPIPFLEELITRITVLSEGANQWLAENINKDQIPQGEIDNILSNNKEKALGCREVCPYCGAKCNEDKGHSGPHTTTRHRLMGLRGSHKYENGRIELVQICCNSEQAQKSAWKDSAMQEAATSGQSLDASVRQLIERENCTMGKLNFTLAWYDPNDIDIHVTCPCGSTLARGSRCSSCGGISDCDMNYGGRDNPTTPVEHVTFDNPKSGQYKVQITKHACNRSYGGHQGKSNSNFKLSVHSGNETFQEWLGNSDHLIQYSFNYQPAIKFFDHCSKYYPKWTITEGGGMLEQKFISRCIIAMKKNEHGIKVATKLA